MRRIPSSFLLLVVTLATTTVPSHARQGMWRAVDGPWGATDVSALAVSDAIYAAATGGVYRSVDGGATWDRDLLAGYALVRDVRALAELPGGTLLAGSYGGGVFRRTPDGWTRISPTQAFVQSIAVSETGSVYAGTTDVLLRSTDGGSTWSSRFVNGKKQTIRGLVAYGTTVLAATSEGIYRSADHGQTWEIASLGLADLNVTALHRMEDGTLLAGTAPIYGGCSLYRSRSEGRLWSCVEPDPAPIRVDAIASLGTGNVVIGGYRQISRSFDAGNTWVVKPAVSSTVKSVLLTGSVVLAGTTGRGIVRSGDGGYTFASSSTGIRSSITDLASGPDGSLYAATAGGVYRGSADGSDWALLDRVGDALAAARSLLVESDGRLLVATNSGARRYDPALGSWEDLGPPGNPAVRDLAIGVDGSIWTGYYEGVFRYQGNRWTPYPIYGPDQAGRDIQAITVGADGRIFAGATYDSFVRGSSSTDWTQLTGSTVPYFEASVFATGPDGILYAGTRYAGVLCSTDQGVVWDGMGSGLMGSEDVRGIEFDAVGAPWIATYGSGVYRYENGIWTNRSNGLEGSMRVMSVHFDDGGTAWAGTDGGGLFRFDPAASTASGSSDMPSGFSVSKPWPNPTRGPAQVTVNLPESATIHVEIFDLLGRRIMNEESGTRAAGSALLLDLATDDLARGLYLVRVTATNRRGRQSATAPIVVEP